MSCQHTEDVCQNCLEKVQTSTEEEEEEDAPPLEKVQTSTEEEKTMTPRQKRISILIDSSFLAVGGVAWYFYNKRFFEFCTMLFDSILVTIGTRNRKE